MMKKKMKKKMKKGKIKGEAEKKCREEQKEHQKICVFLSLIHTHAYASFLCCLFFF